MRLKSRSDGLLGATARASKRKRKARKKKKKEKFWQMPENRPADIIRKDGTQVWFLAPDRVRTVGTNYRRIQ